MYVVPSHAMYVVYVLYVTYVVRLYAMYPMYVWSVLPVAEGLTNRAIRCRDRADDTTYLPGPQPIDRLNGRGFP